MSVLVRYERDAQGVVTLTCDFGGSVNVLAERSITELDAAISRVLADDGACGAIVASAKRDFIVGLDLSVVRSGGFSALATNMEALAALTRRMETGGKPFVAALDGSALGAGAEFALACHRRFGGIEAAATIGFPEIAFGLIPGAGGTQRAPRMAGIEAALSLLLDGKCISFAQAASLGLIDDVLAGALLRSAAREWILAHRDAKRSWDQKSFVFPGGRPQDANVAGAFAVAAAQLRKKTWGNYPATRDVLSAVYEGAQLDIDSALRVETRYVRKTLARPETRMMVKTLFFGVNDANARGTRSPGEARQALENVAVIGAGMMGAGIAFVTARSGARVVLIDRDAQLAARGKERARALGADEATLARIQPTIDYAELADADLIIEAVFEDRAIKGEVTRRAEAAAPATAMIASNTSTLPIATLANTTRHPERFIGLHFFSPVERMRLVEIIRGPATSADTLARALAYVRLLGKTPVVVNDGRGFFTSRVFATYVNEGLAMLREGVAPALIENAGRLAGMAVGPLAVADEVGFPLLHHVLLQTQRDLEDAYVPGIADAVIAAFATTLDRPGKAAGRGAYDYHAGGKKQLWSGLSSLASGKRASVPLSDVPQRLLYVQVLEACRCRAEGVIEDDRAGDVASILGWGFPSFTGGVFSFVEYVGFANFGAECARLAMAYGPRFAPSAGIVQAAV